MNYLSNLRATQIWKCFAIDFISWWQYLGFDYLCEDNQKPSWFFIWITFISLLDNAYDFALLFFHVVIIKAKITCASHRTTCYNSITTKFILQHTGVNIYPTCPYFIWNVKTITYYLLLCLWVVAISCVWGFPNIFIIYLEDDNMKFLNSIKKIMVR